MFALTLLFLIFTNAQYISNSSGLYIWNAELYDIKNLILPETTIYLFGTLNVNYRINNFYINKFIMKKFNNSKPVLNYKSVSLFRINNFEYYNGKIFTGNSICNILNLVLHLHHREDFNKKVYGDYTTQFFNSIKNIHLNFSDIQEDNDSSESLNESEQIQDPNNYFNNYIDINKKTNLTEILNRLKPNVNHITLNEDFIIDRESSSHFIFIIKKNSNLIILKNINIDSIVLQNGYLKVYKNHITILDLHSSYNFDEFLNRFYLNDNFSININYGQFEKNYLQNCYKEINKNYLINNSTLIPLCSNSYNYISSSCNNLNRYCGDMNEYNSNQIIIYRETNMSEIIKYINCNKNQIIIKLYDNFIIDTNHECSNNINFIFSINSQKTLTIENQLTNINRIYLDDGYLKVYENNINIDRIDCNNYKLNEFLNRFEINNNFNININSGWFKLSNSYTCNKKLNGFKINNSNKIKLCKYSNKNNYFSDSCTSTAILNCN